MLDRDEEEAPPAVSRKREADDMDDDRTCAVRNGAARADCTSASTPSSPPKGWPVSLMSALRSPAHCGTNALSFVWGRNHQGVVPKAEKRRPAGLPLRQAAGKPRSQLSVQEVMNEMRRDYSTSRGSQSLDGEAPEKAKQQLKQAQKKGFASILDRFDDDVDYTLHSVAGGFDREFLAIEDVLTRSALPNLGRSQEQRNLGGGAYGGGLQEDAMVRSVARLLYPHDVNPAALRAGLITAVTDLPFCIMWLGGTYSVRKFVDVFLQHKIAKQIVMFSGGPIQLDHTAGYTAEQWYDWIVTRLLDQTAVARRALMRSNKRLKGPRKAQAEADARRQQQSWQPHGSHPYGRGSYGSSYGSSYGGSYGSSYGGSSGRWR